jgi:UDP-GlcNAc:undecaprenyl-phosphate GlcNAc-1-phosphate transferase
MPFTVVESLLIGLALALTLALTPLVRALARRWGMVAPPRSDRWHRSPTALLGGVAVFVAFALVVLTRSHTPQTYAVLGASAFLFLVGLADDLRHLKPYQKLIGQVMGAAVVLGADLSLPWTPWPLVNMAVTIWWLVGITNALNLLDNMDGLAAGVAAIAAAFLGVWFLTKGQSAEAWLLAVFAAALVGFLWYNFNPASIFMGDCGSMFIGFFLAGSALLHNAGGRSRSLLAVLAVPVLILFIPIFDTTFVTIVRKLSGRAVSQGGRDHTSHRLVALGMSERRAVLMLYGFAALAGSLALFVGNWPVDASVAAILGFTVALTLLGVHLAEVRVYEESSEATRKMPLAAFLVNLSYKRRVFEVLLDVALILLAYHLAHTTLFGPIHPEGEGRFFREVAVLVFVQMAALLVAGVYRGLWRYISVDSLVVFARAVVLGSACGVLAFQLVFGPEGFSPALAVLDGVFLFLMLAGSRLAFRVFRRVLPAPHAVSRRRVLIYGAGDAGELLLREMRNNPRLGCLPVGFVDDDPLKDGKVIHGLRVYGGNGSFLSVCQRHWPDEVVISSERFPEERVREILEVCEKAGVGLRRLRIRIETLREAGRQTK